MDTKQLKTSLENLFLQLDHYYQDYFTKRYSSIVLDTTTHINQVDQNTKFNIIISPSLYWIKKASLNVKNRQEALKFAPSLFDFLPNDETYNYEVFGQNDTFIFIAYSSKMITDRIKSLSIQKDKIKNIYFSQTEFLHIPTAIKISSKNVIVTKDDIVFAIPNQLCETTTPLNGYLFSHYFSQYSYGYDHFEEEHIDDKTMITTWVLMFVALLILFSNWFIFNKEIQVLDLEKEEIAKKYAISDSLSKIVAIKKSLLKKEEKQLNIRQKVNYILGLNLEETGMNDVTIPASGSFIAPGTNDLIASLSGGLEDKEYIQELDIKNNELTLKLSMKNDKRAEYIKDYLKQKFKIESIEAKDKIVTAKVKL